MHWMPKMRIHELAKELNVDNKKVMEFLKEKCFAGNQLLCFLQSVV